MELKKTITFLETPDEEVCHELWSTPVITARPFTNEFLDKVEADVQYLLKPGAPGTLNQTNLWDLPDLPDSMRQVQAKFLELAEKYYRPTAEMPMPPLYCTKGYFREIHQNSVYRISPHKHAQTLGVGIIYVNSTPRNAGNLMLMDPRGGVQWHNQFTPFKRIAVERGLMVIHPGYLLHFVEPTDNDNPRYDYRLAIISNMHWKHSDFIKELAKNEEAITRMGSMAI